MCNARCKHCFYWEEIGSAKASKELKLAEIEKAFYDNSGLLYCNIVTNKCKY